MARQSKALVKEAKALGIDVDGRWGDETIQEQIDAAKSDQAKVESDVKAKDAVRQLTAETGGDKKVDEAVSFGGPGSLSAVCTEASVEGETFEDMSVVRGEPVLEGAINPVAEAKGVGGDNFHDSDAGLGSHETADGGRGVASPGSGLPVRLGPENAADAVGSVHGSELVSSDGTAGDTRTHFPDGTPSGLAQAQLSRTVPIVAAYSAASAIFGAFLSSGNGCSLLEERDEWFSPDNSTETEITLVSVAVPFVRTWPEAPVEALYMTVRDGQPALGLEGPWSDLPAANRIAWSAFRDTLLTIDRAIEAEHAKIMAAADVRPVRRIPIDESTLELVDDTFELSDSGKAQANRDEAAALERDLSLTGL